MKSLKMKNLKAQFTILIALCVMCIPCYAMADIGPSCSCDTPGDGGDCVRYNPDLDMGYQACQAYARRSEFCKYAYRNDENDVVFNGFWSEYDGVVESDSEYGQLSPLEACTKICDVECSLEMPNREDYINSEEYESALEKYNDCLTYYKPKEIDCQGIASETDKAVCEQTCHHNVLTSQCGSECLHGLSYYNEGEWGEWYDTINYSGLYHQEMPFDMGEYIYSYCAKEKLCGYYTPSISAKRPSAWSLLAILVAALAAVTTLLITFMNKSNKKEADK